MNIYLNSPVLNQATEHLFMLSINRNLCITASQTSPLEQESLEPEKVELVKIFKKWGHYAVADMAQRGSSLILWKSKWVLLLSLVLAPVVKTFPTVRSPCITMLVNNSFLLKINALNKEYQSKQTRKAQQKCTNQMSQAPFLCQRLKFDDTRGWCTLQTEMYV